MVSGTINNIASTILEMALGGQPALASLLQWIACRICSGSHAEFGRDSRSTFRRNADLDPEIQECRLNLSIFQSDSACCAGLEIVENMHKGV